MGPGTNEQPGEEERERGRKELMHRVTAPTFIPGHQPGPEGGVEGAGACIVGREGGPKELVASDVLSITRNMI